MNDIRKPDTVKVAVTRIDGGVTILQIIEKEYGQDPENSSNRIIHKEYNVTDEYIDSIIKKYVDDGIWKDWKTPVSWRRVPDDFEIIDSDLSREYRNSLKDTGKNKAEHDMVKAKEIHKNKLRRFRFRVLENLDVEYIKTLESDDKEQMKLIVEQKQKLRNITTHPDIENVLSVDELKKLTIEVLSK